MPEEITYKKKPAKVLYENQEEVYKKIMEFVDSKITDDVFEAYLTGSVVRREFGKYVTKFEDHEGSDIDLVTMIPKEKIPKTWKNLNTERTWWNLYSGGKIKINGTHHRLDLLVVKEGMEDKARERLKELGWKLEKIR